MRTPSRSWRTPARSTPARSPWPRGRRSTPPCLPTASPSPPTTGSGEANAIGDSRGDHHGHRRAGAPGHHHHGRRRRRRRWWPHPERGRLRVDRRPRHRGTGRRQRPGHRRVVGRHDAVGRGQRGRRRRRRPTPTTAPAANASPNASLRSPRRIGHLVASGPTAVSSGSPTAAASGSSPTTSPRGSAWRSASSSSAERNSDARGIWSDEETMWVLDGRTDALFAYDIASGDLLAEYALDSANDDPRGIWSDGVTIWVSDHGAKRLIAYRLPVLPDAETDPGEEDADDDARELERVSDEEFTELSKASNNSPRGIWSDGDVMYVADESDDRVYSYNMPDAIDARLASLTLSGVGHRGVRPRPAGLRGCRRGRRHGDDGRGRGDAASHHGSSPSTPPDADTEVDDHQVALQDLGEITVTVTSARRQPDEDLPRAVPRDSVGSGPRCLAALPARRRLRGGSASLSMRGAASRSWSPARRAGASRPSTPCMGASTSPTSSGRRAS